MDPFQERILADLSGQVEGEVRCDPLTLQLYASDASIYELRPLAIVRPRSTADVVATVQYAAENELPVRARGAGTGLAGESLGDGIMIDFSHSMRRVLEVGEDAVRVQPGVVLAQLNNQLRESRRLFGPDPSTRSVTTMGSVIALDGAGSHWPAFGSARRQVRSLQVVLADGEVLELSRHSTSGQQGPSRQQELVRRLTQLLERDRESIQQHWPQSPVNRCGYNVHDVLDHGQLDLARLLVGSEGTLALITEATLATAEMARFRGVTLLFFERLEQAARGALEVAKLAPAACDLMDRRLLSIARETDPRFDRLIPADAEALLLVEHQGGHHEEVREKMQTLIQRLHRKRRLAFHVVSTMQDDERDLFWRLVRRVVPRLYRLKGDQRAVPFIEDVAVPPQRLPEFLLELQNLFKARQVTATVFSHAIQGQLHIRPFLNLDDPDQLRGMQDLASALYELVLEADGTISGEHGTGLSRTWFMRRQLGPVYDTLREVKRIFDPQNIFNPGKVVAEAPQPLTKNLRPTGSGQSGSLPVLLNWGEGGLQAEAQSCNGCGRCRTQSGDERMCPIFRFAPREEASPRAKANMLRAVAAGTLPAAELTTEAMRAYADLCVNCHQCRTECPAGVNIPQLVLEAKSQHVAANGLRFHQWCVSRLERLSSLGSRFSKLANWAIGNRQMRWLIERLLGVAQGRKLPRFSRRTFVRQAARMRLTRPLRQSGPKVLYFVDLYANWHDPDLGQALVAVMRHNNVSVYVPPDPLVSGMPGITLGDTERLKRKASRNVSLLADAVRQGYQVVTTEPSAAACLRNEYLAMLNDDDAKLVADNTLDACEYLWQLHQVGRLELDFRPLPATVGYHLPCHLRTRNAAAPGEMLLRLIPGMGVQRIEEGCSGMAGAFGLMRENYRNSLRAGWGLISAVRDPALIAGVTECSACKLQMEQGTTKPTVHPLKILAAAYGEFGDATELLAAQGRELVAT